MYNNAPVCNYLNKGFANRSTLNLQFYSNSPVVLEHTCNYWNKHGNPLLRHRSFLVCFRISLLPTDFISASMRCSSSPGSAASYNDHQPTLHSSSPHPHRHCRLASVMFSVHSTEHVRYKTHIRLENQIFVKQLLHVRHKLHHYKIRRSRIEVYT